MLNWKNTAAVAAAVCMSTAAFAQEARKAPDFTAADADGKTHSLADFKGKIVVLDFTNPGSPVAGKGACPYIESRYEAKTFNKLADEVKAAGGVYLAVNTANYNTAADSKQVAEKYATNFPTLIDSAGTIGKSYEAKTSPHMFVIDKEGNIAYEGALNDNATPDAAKDAGAKNYVSEAIAAVAKGEKPATAKTQPYGCGLKYK